MNLFFDTSALLKHYIQERGSESIDSLFLEADEIFVSEITIVESFSALSRLVHEKSITKKQCSLVFKEIEHDHHYFSIVPLVDSFKNAMEAIYKYQLKTLDGLQIGSALVVKEQIDNFVCSDKKLSNAAKSENFSVLAL
ncbi:MAG: type II toxin-antitoxin system VapC family toxin [Leptospira sp.]|nr:type II toxin-antitoxin system VapC family toxin [Leptospira sp.]